ncbi:MAG: hypothetical protein Q9161_009111 [Pseudevernia consocians]
MGLTPQFPCLRRVSLRNVVFSDYSVLDALLEGGLRDMEVDLGQDCLYSEFFDERGTIPELTTLVWDGMIENDQSLSFLQANTQLSKLSLQREASGAFLETRLLPLLTESFRQLTSLSLKWKGDSIPGSALQAIASLVSLQELHLSAGHQHGQRYNWFIDHDLMRSRLKNLTSLKLITFSRDVCKSPVEGSARELYHGDRIYHALIDDVDSDQWKNWHLLRTPTEMKFLAPLTNTNDFIGMLKEANVYATEMPGLERLHLGQLTMEVSREEESRGGDEVIFHVSFEGDEFPTYLKEAFWWNPT